MTDTELKRLLDESESFWRQVAIDNHRVPVNRPKRPRPECLNPKPHIRYNQGQWECECVLRLTDEDLFVASDSPEEAFAYLCCMINRRLDWDHINAANFIYIEFLLIYCPPLVFDLLPPAIQGQYA